MQGYCHAYIYGCAHRPAAGPLLACACNDGMLRLWAVRSVQGGPELAPPHVSYQHCVRLTAGGGANALVSVVMDASGGRLAVAVKDGGVFVLVRGAPGTPLRPRTYT